jgi:hypothetical protein
MLKFYSTRILRLTGSSVDYEVIWTYTSIVIRLNFYRTRILRLTCPNVDCKVNLCLRVVVTLLRSASLFPVTDIPLDSLYWLFWKLGYYNYFQLPINHFLTCLLDKI